MKLDFGSTSFETSNDDKQMFGNSDITKADVIEYYRDVAEIMLPHARNRCLTLHRFPDGIGEYGFYQQNRPDHFPSFVGACELPKASGEATVEHIVVEDAAGLVYLADQGTITFHGWLASIERPRHPDRIVFDLDPSGDSFRPVIDCARTLRDALENAGLVPFVMTSGSRGLHVSAPLDASVPFDDARRFARHVAEQAAAEDSERFTTEQRKQARQGRLYIDTGRNAYGQTAVLPYSLRALNSAPVATPLDWEELGKKDLAPRRYDIANLRRRLAQKTDPFAEFFDEARRPSLPSD